MCVYIYICITQFFSMQLLAPLFVFVRAAPTASYVFFEPSTQCRQRCLYLAGKMLYLTEYVRSCLRLFVTEYVCNCQEMFVPHRGAPGGSRSISQEDEIHIRTYLNTYIDNINKHENTNTYKDIYVRTLIHTHKCVPWILSLSTVSCGRTLAERRREGPCSSSPTYDIIYIYI